MRLRSFRWKNGLHRRSFIFGVQSKFKENIGVLLFCILYLEIIFSSSSMWILHVVTIVVHMSGYDWQWWRWMWILFKIREANTRICRQFKYLTFGQILSSFLAFVLWLAMAFRYCQAPASTSSWKIALFSNLSLAQLGPQLVVSFVI